MRAYDWVTAQFEPIAFVYSEIRVFDWTRSFSRGPFNYIKICFNLANQSYSRFSHLSNCHDLYSQDNKEWILHNLLIIWNGRNNCLFFKQTTCLWSMMIYHVKTANIYPRRFSSFVLIKKGWINLKSNSREEFLPEIIHSRALIFLTCQ